MRNAHGYSDGEMRLHGLGIVWSRRHDWSWKTFGPAEHRGPIGTLKHLEREAREAQDNPANIEEFADCLILTLDAADRAGFTLEELLTAALDKLRVNEQRDWPDWRIADPSEPVEHFRIRPGGGGE